MPAIGNYVRQLSSDGASLRDVLSAKIPQEQERVKKFRKEFGSTKMGETTIDMMYGGMRGIRALVTETSVLDADEGIRFRGLSIPECQRYCQPPRVATNLCPRVSSGC